MRRWSDGRAVLAAALTMAATLPGRTHGMGLATERLLRDFPAVSPPAFAQMNLVATLSGSLACVPAGWLLDRFGARRVGMLVVSLLAMSVWWMAHVADPASLAVAIAFTRALGQSMLSVVSLSIIGKAFPRCPGVPMACYAIVMTLMMVAVTLLLGSYVKAFDDWRVPWSGMALVLLGLVPVVGLLAGGPAPRTPKAECLIGDPASDATLAQALLTPCFWTFGLSISLFGLVSAGISLFQQSMFQVRGLDETVYHHSLAIGLLAGLIANLGIGWLTSRTLRPAILAGAMFALALSLWALPHIRSPAEAYAFALVHGLAGGSLSVLFFAVWGYAFGTRELARIQGAAQMLTVVASAGGPLIVTSGQGADGSYTIVLTVLGGLAAACGAWAWWAPVPSAAAGYWNRSPDLPPSSLVKETP